eukprot:gnl/Chilomastix_caulleri/295.p1 GENE.gnl/Chilomastix_caulleri/295~~gnl/Chilomastix_caulleri/295.p1  ORF type:complete len:144 (+),score=32.20 gnl/Chilomastix_caulleri/295:80-511(+)
MPEEIRKAARVAKTLKTGVHRVRKVKVRHNVHYFRKNTKHTALRPKYPRTIVTKSKAFSEFDVLRYPVATEHSMSCAEEANTLTFMVSKTATKNAIKEAFYKIYGVIPVRVNTLVSPLCEKKAYIKLPADVNASNFASKNKLQ